MKLQELIQNEILTHKNPVGKMELLLKTFEGNKTVLHEVESIGVKKFDKLLKKYWLTAWNKNVEKSDIPIIKKYVGTYSPAQQHKLQKSILEIDKNEKIEIKSIPELTQAINAYKANNFKPLEEYVTARKKIKSTEGERIFKLINQKKNTIDIFIEVAKKSDLLHLYNIDFSHMLETSPPNKLKEFRLSLKNNDKHILEHVLNIYFYNKNEATTSICRAFNQIARNISPNYLSNINMFLETNLHFPKVANKYNVKTKGINAVIDMFKVMETKFDNDAYFETPEDITEMIKIIQSTWQYTQLNNSLETASTAKKLKI